MLLGVGEQESCLLVWTVSFLNKLAVPPWEALGIHPAETSMVRMLLLSNLGVKKASLEHAKINHSPGERALTCSVEWGPNTHLFLPDSAGRGEVEQEKGAKRKSWPRVLSILQIPLQAIAKINCINRNIYLGPTLFLTGSNELITIHLSSTLGCVFWCQQILKRKSHTFFLKLSINQPKWRFRPLPVLIGPSWLP